MTLDFYVDRDNQENEPYVGLPADVHWRLVEIAKALSLGLFERFYDYYADGKIGREEVDDWLAELRRVAVIVQQTPELVRAVRELIELASRAKAQSKGIVAWAD